MKVNFSCKITAFRIVAAFLVIVIERVVLFILMSSFNENNYYNYMENNNIETSKYD